MSLEQSATPSGDSAAGKQVVLLGIELSGRDLGEPLTAAPLRRIESS